MIMKVFDVPIQVYQAAAIYAKGTGEEVYINDLCIGADARAFVHCIKVVDGEMKLDIIYITHDIHPTIMDRCKSDSLKVSAYMGNLTKGVPSE